MDVSEMESGSLLSYILGRSVGISLKMTLNVLFTCNVFSPLFNPLFFMLMLNNNHVNDQQNE